MSDINKLQTWMNEQGYSISSLAKELGVSYYGVYLVIHRNRISPGFRARFIERFGTDVAQSIFTPYGTRQPEPA